VNGRRRAAAGGVGSTICREPTAHGLVGAGRAIFDRDAPCHFWPRVGDSTDRDRGRNRGRLLYENVLVLRVARDQPALPILVRDDELESVEGRIDGEER
jgi:hypothetical protein